MSMPSNCNLDYSLWPGKMVSSTLSTHLQSLVHARNRVCSLKKLRIFTGDRRIRNTLVACLTIVCDSTTVSLRTEVRDI